MSEELIYKVAWEINIKQEEIMEEIVELKDLMVDNNSKTDALLKILKENAVEMAKISVALAPKEDSLEEPVKRRVVRRRVVKRKPTNIYG